MRYVVLGASAAGINGAETLRRLDPNAEIILVSEDEKVYSRCILHYYLEDIRNVEELNFVAKDFFEKNRIQWLKGTRAVSLKPEENRVGLSCGEELEYDKLLIATGSHPFIPPIENFKGAENVVGLRSLDDCETIKRYAHRAENILVIGGGLIGVDALTGLLHSGANLTLVEMKGHLLPLQLDPKSSKTYEELFAKEGVKMYFDTKVAGSEADEKGNIKSVTLTTGEVIPTDLVIVAGGVRANVDFLKDSGVALSNLGLIIDDKGKTNFDNIYGAGDVTGEMPIWPTAVKEAIIAASNMAGKERVFDDFFASKSTMNFFDIPTMSIGEVNPPEGMYEVEIQEDDKGNYKKIVHRDGIIYGGLIQGDISYTGILLQLIKEKIDVSKTKKPLFDIDYSDFFHLTENFEFTY